LRSDQTTPKASPISEGGLDEPRALDEEARRLVLDELLGARARAGIGRGERRHAPGYLARNPEQLAAGREQARVRAAPRDPVGEVRARADQVLAVVEHDQDRGVVQVVDERRLRRPGRLLGRTDRAEHRARHERLVAERREVDYPDAVWVVLDDLGGGLERQARLARSPRAGQRHQSAPADERLHLGELALATDEAGQLERQVVGRRVQAAQRWEVVGRARGAGTPARARRGRAAGARRGPGGRRPRAARRRRGRAS
jgi:hypothetical protein